MGPARPLGPITSGLGHLWTSLSHTQLTPLAVQQASRHVSTSCVASSKNESGGEPVASGLPPPAADASASASTSKASSASEGPVAGGSSQDGDPADKKGKGSATWDGMVDEWSKTLVNYHAQGREMMDEAASRNKLAQFEGSQDGVADATFDAPVNSTRVWLHMHDTPSGLQPSFCRRTGDAHYMYDFQGFQDWRVEQNALLSDESKCLMFKLHKESPELWDSALLGRVFRIREQRALSIIKLKNLEFEQAERCTEALNRLQELFGLQAKPRLEELRKDRFRHSVRHLTAWFEPWLQFYEAMPYLIAPPAGSSEASDEAADEASEAAAKPEAPAPEAPPTPDTNPAIAQAAAGEDAQRKGPQGQVVLSDAEQDEVVDLHNLLTRAANAEAKHIACDQDIWKCNHHFGTGERYRADIKTYPSFEELPLEEAGTFQGGELEHASAHMEATQDAAEIADFKLQLAWSLGEIGQTIQRAPRKRSEKGNTLPKKPEGGWPILMTELKADGVRGGSSVYALDGSARELTDDEKLYLKHFKREPKFFSRPRRQEPFTNHTLHAFQRKPNKQHDIYNPKYEGNPKNKRPTSGPDRRTQRLEKMKKRTEEQALKSKLKAMNQ